MRNKSVVELTERLQKRVVICAHIMPLISIRKREIAHWSNENRVLPFVERRMRTLIHHTRIRIRDATRINKHTSGPVSTIHARAPHLIAPIQSSVIEGSLIAMRGGIACHGVHDTAALTSAMHTFPDDTYLHSETRRVSTAVVALLLMLSLCS